MHFEPPLQGPEPGPVDDQHRQEAEQEGGEDQDRQLRIGFEPAPQLDGDGVPVDAREQHEDHRERDPEQGFQELHATLPGGSRLSPTKSPPRPEGLSRPLTLPLFPPLSHDPTPPPATERRSAAPAPRRRPRRRPR